MKRAWLKILVGEALLPECPLERSRLLEEADSHHVLGQLSSVWEGKVSGKTQEVMKNGSARAAFDHKMLHFEMERIERALQGTGIKPILLKGASYVARGIKAGLGRRVSDIDILVSEHDLAEVERCFKAGGWSFDETTDNEYDQAYYREHMHELPPLQHMFRRTYLDVHHRLLPRTARISVNSEAFISNAEVLSGRALKVFTSIDTFLHSAIHAFGDGSFDTPARSIIELKYLLADIETSDHEQLLERAHIVGAEIPTALAFWSLARYLEDETAASLHDNFKVKCNPLVCWAIGQKLSNISKARAAKFLLYLRSHYLRMPWVKLIKHLTTKAFRRVKKEPNLQLPPGFQ